MEFCKICKIKRGADVSFHYLPQNTDRAKNWFKSLNLPIPVNIEKLKKHFIVCSNHFKASDYNMIGSLRRTAEPMAYNPIGNSAVDTENKDSTEERCNVTVKYEDMETNMVVSDIKTQIIKRMAKDVTDNLVKVKEEPCDDAEYTVWVPKLEIETDHSYCCLDKKSYDGEKIFERTLKHEEHVAGTTDMYIVESASSMHINNGTTAHNITDDMISIKEELCDSYAEPTDMPHNYGELVLKVEEVDIGCDCIEHSLGFSLNMDKDKQSEYIIN